MLLLLLRTTVCKYLANCGVEKSMYGVQIWGKHLLLLWKFSFNESTDRRLFFAPSVVEAAPQPREAQ